MFQDTDQHEAVIDGEGRVILPRMLLESQGWRPGTKLLIEETDEGLLVTTG